MHDHDELDAVERGIARSAPAGTDEATLARVAQAARSRAAGGRPLAMRWLRPAVAAASILAVAGLAFALAGRGPHVTIAFAEEDALAVLKPAVGQVVHIKTRTVARNHGEPESEQGGSGEYEESWIDFAGDRARSLWRSSETDAILSDSVQVNGRVRFIGDDPETPEPTRCVGDGHALGRAGDLTFWAYSYLPERLPDGKVVGEVVKDGQRCWDVRWENSEDSAGNKLNARALFRQPDYRPLLVERDYPGGAIERWEVLEWTVVDASDVPTGTFDPSTIGGPDTPSRFAWYADELDENVGYPVYWAGEKVAELQVLADLEEPVPGKVKSTPFFLEYANFDTPSDALFDGMRTTAEYAAMTEGEGPVAVSSGRRVPTKELDDAFAKLWRAKPASRRRSAIGTACVAKLPNGGYVAGIQTADSTVIVEAPDSGSLDSALAQLERVQ